jgi:hypothetical protein
MRANLGIFIVAVLCLGTVSLTACSSSLGGGSSPSQPNTVIVPPGSKVVCSDGSAPPC